MSTSKRISLKPRGFDELPPRTIIFDIFAFYDKVVRNEYSKCSEDFSLYGIFKLDRRRNIWFFFTSIQFLGFYPNFFKCRFNLFKLGYLKLSNRGNTYTESDISLKFARMLIKNAPKMYRLKTLDICQFKNDENVFGSLFSNPAGFPKLERVNVRTKDSQSILTPQFEENYESKVKRLEISSGNDDTDEYWIHPILRPILSDFMKTLKIWDVLQELFIHHGRLEVERTIKLPLLRKLRLWSCRNINIATTEQLRYLELHRMESESIKISLQGATNIVFLSLEEIEWKSIENRDWFLNEDFNPLLKLENLSLYDVGLSETSAQNLKRICHNCQRLKITPNIGSRCDFIFLTPFPKIKHLYTQLPHDELLRKIVYSDQLLSFECRHQRIPEELFSKTRWSNLEVLGMMNVGEINENYTRDLSLNECQQFKNLKCLNFSHFNINDYFFRDQNFVNLETFVLIRMDQVTGSGWKKSNSDVLKFSNLKKIILVDCGSFKDDFLQDFDFPNLDYILIDGMDSIEGRAWNIRNCEVLFFRNSSLYHIFLEEKKERLKRRNISIRKVEKFEVSDFL